MLGVLQVCRGFDFLHEPIGAEHGGEFRSEHLHRDLAKVFHILGEKPHRHATGAKFTLDSVAIYEGRSETVNLLGHATKIWRDSPCRDRRW